MKKNLKLLIILIATQVINAQSNNCPNVNFVKVKTLNGDRWVLENLDTGQRITKTEYKTAIGFFNKMCLGIVGRPGAGMYSELAFVNSMGKEVSDFIYEGIFLDTFKDGLIMAKVKVPGVYYDNYTVLSVEDGMVKDLLKDKVRSILDIDILGNGFIKISNKKTGEVGLIRKDGTWVAPQEKRRVLRIINESTILSIKTSGLIQLYDSSGKVTATLDLSDSDLRYSGFYFDESSGYFFIGNNEEPYFYLDENLKCVEYNEVSCPEY